MYVYICNLYVHVFTGAHVYVGAGEHVCFYVKAKTLSAVSFLSPHSPFGIVSQT